MTQIDLNGAAPGKGKDAGGGMERVLWVSDTKAKDQEENSTSAFESVPSKSLSKNTDEVLRFDAGGSL